MSDTLPIIGQTLGRSRPSPGRRPSARASRRPTTSWPGSTSRSAPPSSTRARRCSSSPAPGSGKTRVLTRRIAWLVSQRGAHPGSILAITFTNKAAAEMKERVEALVGPRARLMWVSTFHSACVRILRKEIDKLGFRSSFTIYDAADSKRLMTMVIKDLDLDPRRYQPGAVLHWVSDHKNELRGPEEVAADTHNKFEEAYAAAYTRYQQRLRDANALDFDDILMFTVDLFATFPEVRETYRRRFRHVLVDEYQDTNHAQYALIHQLCADALEDPISSVEPVETTPPSGSRPPS